FRWKTDMTKTAIEQYWGRHIEAVKTQAITAKAYAQRHGLVLSTRYYSGNAGSNRLLRAG
ncbi:hypothetical protein, partial [Polaromonas sp.]|uniref:hypothetical protein n=1 Tax=Polaromonas sp. TaxID=1869339 RepID=UPI003BB7D927